MKLNKISSVVAHDKVTCVKLGSRTGQVYVTGGVDRKVNLWSIGKQSAILTLTGFTSPVSSVALDYPEELVVAGSSSGLLKLWDLGHAQVIRSLAGHKTCVDVVQFHPFGEFFASGCADGTVKVWDIRRKGCIQTYVGHTGGISTLAITPDGRWVASGSADKTLKIWDMTAGKVVHTLQFGGRLTALSFNPCEFVMGASDSDGFLGLYDLITFACISSLQSDEPVSCLAFHPDGKELLVAKSDSVEICEWDPLSVVRSASSRFCNIVDLMFVDGPPKIMAVSTDQQFTEIYSMDYHLESKVAPKPGRNGATTPKSGLSLMSNAPSLSNFDGMDVIESVDHLKDSATQSSILSLSALSQTSPMMSHSNLNSKVNLASSAVQAVQVNLASSSGQAAPVNLSSSAGQAAPANLFSSAGQTAPRPRSSYVTLCDGSRPLNLDLSRFIYHEKGSPSAPQMPLSPTSQDQITSEQDVLDLMSCRHASIEVILGKRLIHLRNIRDAWDESDIKPCLVSLITMRDSSVWIDFLKILNLKPRLLNLEACAILVGPLTELLYIVTVCTTARLLARQFSDVILSTLSSKASGIDLSREDRMGRCETCLAGFKDMAAILNECQVSGKSGQLVRQTRSDLEVFCKIV